MKRNNKKLKRKLRNRKKLKEVNVNRYRISVSKSLNNLSAQIIDDIQKKTLVSASSKEKTIKDNLQSTISMTTIIVPIFKKSAKIMNNPCEKILAIVSMSLTARVTNLPTEFLSKKAILKLKILSNNFTLRSLMILWPSQLA